MEKVPLYISSTFIGITLITLLLFVHSIRHSSNEQIRGKSTLIFWALVGWLILQAVLTLNKTYSSDVNAFPPKIILFGILPTILVIITLFYSRNGKLFIDSLPLKNLTFINVVRILVEFVLYGLFIYQVIPELMTFEGRNFDILAGISAPFVAYFGFTKQKMNKKILLIWNFICLGLLINIIIYAILSAPSPFQKFAFDQANIAILNFPFSWLPTFIVPIVLLGHFVSIRQLLHEIRN